jgi:uncharacterized protein
MKHRPIFNILLKRLREPRRLIQALLGPRQVGKTTLALQAAEAINRPCHYASADQVTLQEGLWLEQQWRQARSLVDPKAGGVLILDEVQKIPNWAELVKRLWDEDTRHSIPLHVVILGSSPWLTERGLGDSLAGRFEVLPITHWPYGEMAQIFGWSLEQFVYFGGYPGSAPLADGDDPSRWSNYINDSLIETTLSRDILLMTRINKPALLRRLFHLGCSYSGQVLSYNKMIGELQEAGNATTLAHYLELLAGAGLMTGVQKYSGHTVRQKGSSPKLLVYNTALISAQSTKTLAQAQKDPIYWGRLVESAVGGYLLNSIRGTRIELFYWREGNHEVDYVLQCGQALTAIEVKSNAKRLGTGMAQFRNRYPQASVLLVGEQGMPLAQFLKTPVSDLVVG